MDFLGPYHPAIVHLPIAFLIGSALFEIIGRAVDLDWWRRAAFAMLVIGMLGAGLAVLSGHVAHEPAEHLQGVPEAAVDAHEKAATITLILSVLAVVARLIAGVGGRAALGAVALLLQLATAASVGVAGYRGGQLVFRHAAGVRVNGELVRESAPEHGAAPPGK